jgi:hypothetical protein
MKQNNFDIAIFNSIRKGRNVTFEFGTTTNGEGEEISIKIHATPG